jgi:hypothetical protein
MTPLKCAICGETDGVVMVQLDCVTSKPRCPVCRQRLEDIGRALAWRLHQLAVEAGQRKAEAA